MSVFLLIRSDFSISLEIFRFDFSHALANCRRNFVLLSRESREKSIETSAISLREQSAKFVEIRPHYFYTVLYILYITLHYTLHATLLYFYILHIHTCCATLPDTKIAKLLSSNTRFFFSQVVSQGVNERLPLTIAGF